MSFDAKMGLICLKVVSFFCSSSIVLTLGLNMMVSALTFKMGVGGGEEDVWKIRIKEDSNTKKLCSGHNIILSYRARRLNYVYIFYNKLKLLILASRDTNLDEREAREKLCVL